MAEIMNEIRLPSYYKSFTKNFKFFVSETEPDLSVFKNYAICEHTVDNVSKFCSIEKVPHFHILFECSSPSQISLIKTRKLFTVPCLYSTFFHLFVDFALLESYGDTLQKLILAVEFNKNSTEHDTLQFSTPIQKRLPQINKITQKEIVSTEDADYVKKPKRPVKGMGQKSIQNTICYSNQNRSCMNCSTQTDTLPKETLERFEKIINGPHSGVLCKFMDIVVSGYGKIDIDSELVFVKLSYEEKIKF